MLTAPLVSGDHKVTTRSVAEQTGVSQSTVSRIWRASFNSSERDVTVDRPMTAVLVGVHVGPSGCLLVLRSTGPHAEQPTAADRRARNAIRTLLVASLLNDSPRTTETDVKVDAFIAHLLGSFRPSSLTFWARGYAPPVLRGDSARRGAGLVVVVADQWTAQLARLESITGLADPEPVASAQVAVREWARRPESPFSWVHEPDASPADPVPTVDLSSPGERTAQSVMDGIQEWLLAGRFRAGDRITESYVSRTLRMSRGQARDALMILAADGLVDFQPQRGVSIPRPTVEDVLETYAVRRALGTLIVQRLTNLSHRELRPIEEALQTVVDAAGTGEVRRTGDADLALQDTMAAASGMKRIPRTFWKSTTQLRLFIAVMGLNYGYSSEAIVADNSRLVEAVLAHDEVLATEIWRTKVQDAATYMLRQLDRRAASLPGRSGA